MRKIYIIILSLLNVVAICAQTPSTEARTLVVKTTDGQTSRFSLDEIAELTFDNAPAEISTVTRMLNLSPDFFSISGIEEGQTLIPGEQAELTLTAGTILSAGFQNYHFEHLHIHVNDQVIVPEAPADYTPANELKIPFTVPEGDCDIVACYSIQQQKIGNGYTMTLEENPHVKLFGVSPDCHYKYFDAYLLANEAYVIKNVEFKMGNGDWTSVDDTAGCSLSADESVANLYHISIRPDQQNVTADVTLRVNGEQHHRYNITWANATDKYIDLEKSILPTQAIDGDLVTAELWVNENYYLRGASASDGTSVQTIRYAYAQFTMPATDVNITLDITDKVPVTASGDSHIIEANIYNYPDIYAGWIVPYGIPGEDIYIIARAEEGYKPISATNDAGVSSTFTHYGADMYVCPVTMPADAQKMTVTVASAKAYTVTSQQYISLDQGTIYARGETVKFTMKAPDGKQIDTVTAKTTSGTDVPLALDIPYATFTMPAEDVEITITYSDIAVEDVVSVIAYYDEDQYRVRSSTNYDWDFAQGFTASKGTTIYLEVYDDYGEDFYVGVKIGEEATTYHANFDEDWGEYSFGKAFVANGDVTIKVGPTENSVQFTQTPAPATVTVKATFDEDQYRVKSSTNYDWDFAQGFTVEKGTTFYLTVQDDYGENFYVGVKIGEEATTYPATEDEDTGEYTFGKSITATADTTIKVGPTEASVGF